MTADVGHENTQSVVRQLEEIIVVAAGLFAINTSGGNIQSFDGRRGCGQERQLGIPGQTV